MSPYFLTIAIPCHLCFPADLFPVLCTVTSMNLDHRLIMPLAGKDRHLYNVGTETAGTTQTIECVCFSLL